MSETPKPPPCLEDSILSLPCRISLCLTVFGLEAIWKDGLLVLVKFFLKTRNVCVCMYLPLEFSLLHHFSGLNYPALKEESYP